MKMKLSLAALALSTALVPLSASAEPTTKMKWGCEWQKAENGNYWFRTDPSCNFAPALGHNRMRDLYGMDPKPAKDDGGDDDDEGEDGGDSGSEGEGSSSEGGDKDC